MNKGICTLGIFVIVLTGCAPSADGAAPTATVTVTVTQPAVTVTATPSVESQGKTPMPLGSSGTSSAGGTITVYEHKKNVEPQNADQEAIDVKVCVGPKPADAAPEDYPVIGSARWALYDAESRQYNPASTTWSHEAAQPGFPVEQRVAWADCIRGWVIIQGQASTAMTKVRYTAGSSILEWKLAG